MRCQACGRTTGKPQFSRGRAFGPVCFRRLFPKPRVKAEARKARRVRKAEAQAFDERQLPLELEMQ